MSEVVFQGTAALSLDGKGRVTVPVRHREPLLALSAGQLTVTKHPVGCLQVFPQPAWDRFAAALTALPAAADDWRRFYLGAATAVEIDSGSRILVSPELRQWAGLDKDVLMIGVGHRLELWDAARHAIHESKVMASPMPAALQDFVF